MFCTSEKTTKFKLLCYMCSYCSANKWPASSISVVKLFNAVSKHQKEMESKLKSAPTEAKKSKGEQLQLWEL